MKKSRKIGRIRRQYVSSSFRNLFKRSRQLSKKSVKRLQIYKGVRKESFNLKKN